MTIIKLQSDLWVVWCSDHNSDGGFRLLRSEGGQQSHPEHDVVQELGVGSEPSSAILQTQPLWLRMETGLLGYFIKHCHLSNKQTNTRSAPKPIQDLILCFCILSCQLFHFMSFVSFDTNTHYSPNMILFGETVSEPPVLALTPRTETLPPPSQLSQNTTQQTTNERQTTPFTYVVTFSQASRRYNNNCRL